MFGGTSAEREVSLKSGAAVLKALQNQGIDAHAFDPKAQELSELKTLGFERVPQPNGTQRSQCHCFPSTSPSLDGGLALAWEPNGWVTGC